MKCKLVACVLVAALAVTSGPSYVFAATSTTQGATLSETALSFAWLPVDVLGRALIASGWGSKWMNSTDTWALTLPKDAMWNGKLSARAGAHTMGEMRVTINGRMAGFIEKETMPVPDSGTPTVYTSLYSLRQLLMQEGIVANLQAAQWSLTERSSAAPLAPPMKSNSLSATTLVAVAGQDTTLTDDVSVAQSASPGSGHLSLTLGGQSLGIKEVLALTPRAGSGKEDSVYQFSFVVPGTVAPGHYPLSVEWKGDGRAMTYTATVQVPALLIAEQSGLFEDNMLGHRLYPSGGFADASQPTGLVYDPVTQTVFVSDAEKGAIYEYTTSGKLVAKLDPPILQSPKYLALNAAGNRLYVYNDSGESPGLIQLTLTGTVIPFQNTQFSSIFSSGNGMAYDPRADRLFVTRELGGSQYASGSSPVVAFNATTGDRVHVPGNFAGVGQSPYGIAYDPQSNELYVCGIYSKSNHSHYVGAYSADGTKQSRATAFPIGLTNTGSANAIAYDPVNGLLLVLGDANLHYFTPEGQPMPPLTSTSSSATPVAALGHGGSVAIAIAY